MIKFFKSQSIEKAAEMYTKQFKKWVLIYNKRSLLNIANSSQNIYFRLELLFLNAIDLESIIAIYIWITLLFKSKKMLCQMSMDLTISSSLPILLLGLKKCFLLQ